MGAAYGFVHHGDSVVGIADRAFTLGIERQLLAAEDILSGAFAGRLKIAGGAYIGPSDVVPATEQFQRLVVSGGKRLEGFGEVRGVRHTQRVLWVDVQASGAAYHKQAGVGARKKITQVSDSLRDLGNGFRCPCAEGVDHYVKAFQVVRRQLEQIPDDTFSGARAVLTPHDGGHVKSSCQCFGGNQLTRFSVGTYDCSFHFFGSPLILKNFPVFPTCNFIIHRPEIL